MKTALIGVLWGGLTLYAVLGGADFGAGVLHLRASERRRAAITTAMGPLWEANHVWLIFFLTGLLTLFPGAFSALGSALFAPATLVLFGLSIRGAALLAPGPLRLAFGLASASTPFVYRRDRGRARARPLLGRRRPVRGRAARRGRVHGARRVLSRLPARGAGRDVAHRCARARRIRSGATPSAGSGDARGPGLPGRDPVRVARASPPARPGGVRVVHDLARVGLGARAVPAPHRRAHGRELRRRPRRAARGGDRARRRRGGADPRLLAALPDVPVRAEVAR